MAYRTASGRSTTDLCPARLEIVRDESWRLEEIHFKYSALVLVLLWRNTILKCLPYFNTKKQQQNCPNILNNMEGAFFCLFFICFSFEIAAAVSVTTNVNENLLIDPTVPTSAN